MPYKPKLYNSFQFIAYETPTLSVYPAAPKLENSKLAPVPNMKGLTDDSTNRLKRFARVLEGARAQVSNKDEPLKIFVAPEFYFRPNSGENNSYTIDEATSLMHALRGMFTKKEWEHWLIVPGSVFWKEATKVGDVYWNTSLLIKGGPDGPNVFVDKTCISKIDGAPTDQGPDTNPYFKDYFSYATRLRSLNQIDNVRFGNEICLDHGKAYLKTTQCLSYEQKEKKDINIQILTACGMQPKLDCMAAEVKGHFLRVDGVPNTIDKNWPYQRSQMLKIIANNFDDVKTMAKVVDLTPKSKAIDVPKTLQVESPDNKNYTQRVRIYDKQAL